MKLTELLIPTKERMPNTKVPMERYPNTLTIESILKEIEDRVEGSGNYTLLEAFQTVTKGAKNWIEAASYDR